jgi:hypothetical protein
MSNAATVHSLISDITPWWWSTHWGQKQITQAVFALLTTKKFDIAQIKITREQLQVRFALAEQEDANRTQERVDALKMALDDMVTG